MSRGLTPIEHEMLADPETKMQAPAIIDDPLSGFNIPIGDAGPLK